MKELLRWFADACKGVLRYFVQLVIVGLALLGVYAGVTLGMDLSQGKCAAVTAHTSVCTVETITVSASREPTVESNAPTL
jgi:uncharacterized membrane protein